MQHRTILGLVMAEQYAEHFEPALSKRLPQVRLLRSEDPELGSAEFALAIAPEPGRLAAMPALRCVIAPGAGVDHILADPGYPNRVLLARLSQPDLRQRMTEYVLLHVLRIHRRFADYQVQQARQEWRIIWPQKAAPERVVAVMGLGELGGPIAQMLDHVGFEVRGWSRSPKCLPGVQTYSGSGELAAFLDGAEILVNLLPATAETRCLLNERSLAWLPAGSSLINVGRGATVDETALLDALDRGQLAEAVLDVFQTEPLPPAHPFWRHPKVTVTPHCASAVTPDALAEGVAEVIDCVLSGRKPKQLVDLRRGY